MIPVIIIYALAVFLNICGGVLASDRWLSDSRSGIRELTAAAAASAALTAFTFFVNKGNNDTACLVWGGVISLMIISIVFKAADKRLSLLLFMIY